MTNQNIELAYEVPTDGKSKSRYILSSRRKLQVEIEYGESKQQYSIDLLSMHPKSKRLREKSPHNPGSERNLLTGMVAAGLLIATVLLFYLMQPMIAGAISIVLVLFSLIFLKTRKGSAGPKRKQVFVSRVARVPMVEITFVRQSKKLQQFVDLLEKRIAMALNTCQLEEKELLAGELRALRRLAENGFLEKRLYEKAKRFLLNTSN